jgi:hypothetical protein
VSKELPVKDRIDITELLEIRWAVVINEEPVTTSPLILSVGETVSVFCTSGTG